MGWTAAISGGRPVNTRTVKGNPGEGIPTGSAATAPGSEDIHRNTGKFRDITEDDLNDDTVNFDKETKAKILCK